ncbi:MAG: carboxylating nicotinate-nucleotide diphosphorylase [Gemmatimonadota bacterium]|nr:carboxylating nicotinate-nucleotide diphosphorylase [Candidatus Palauibacterales bacterium]
MEEVLSSQVRHQIAEALAEDIGTGDWTTLSCVDAELEGKAGIVTRQPGTVAGLEAAAAVYLQLGGAELIPEVDGGASVVEGDTLARVRGKASAILTGERLALNFLGHLSGVATLTRRFVDAIAGTGAKISDTRKTTPLWRELERAATRAGGAVNHRSGLDEMILIKENHLTCAGSIREAVRRAQSSNAHDLKIEVETTSLDDVKAALDAGVDRIMLDNMPVELVREAVGLIGDRSPGTEIEASGGITLDSVFEFAETGVDYISIGALTHSAPALDLSLLISTA